MSDSKVYHLKETQILTILPTKLILSTTTIILFSITVFIKIKIKSQSIPSFIFFIFLTNYTKNLDFPTFYHYFYPKNFKKSISPIKSNRFKTNI